MQSSAPSYHRGTLVLIMGILTMFAPFATDTYLAGFPQIAESLNCSSGDIQISLSTFFFGLAIGQLFYGPISDQAGRKKPLLAGILLYILTSVAAPLSPNIEVFAAIRFLQGVGGCAGMVISRAIIRDLFDTGQSARVLSLLMVLQALGPILAPILGGYILLVTSWHGIFIFLVVVGVFSFCASIIAIPETLPVEDRQLTRMRGQVAVFVTFLCNRRFIIPTLAGSIAASSMFAFISGSPFVIMELYGVTPQQYGWLFGLNASGFIVSSFANRYLLKHFSPAKILFSGIVFALISSAIALSFANTEHLALLLVPLFCSLSMVPVVAANSVAVAMEAAKKHAGSGSSLIGVLQFGVASLISALVGTLHNGTSYPMTGMIFSVYLLAGVIVLLCKDR